ncbi:ribosomal protein L25/L23 [Ophiocordyceps camponoti-floridani]|uniref:Large ribosomal subunit protein uL23m n=1 Tax=Ophiocordyceps camponoti-floridani TaxID=2030778 RepID=A0A8H4QBF8_9HYPO|nr:ribosomal protein L25/L23 [Ophiocordyceps camponoti-floridani]
MAEAFKAMASRSPAFKLGQKKLYLPQHVIAMMRFPNVPHNEACFRVPRRFNKFDLRDYLWNVYGVEVKKVRSNVVQQPISLRRNTSNSSYRPEPLKYMRVTLCKPFEWPARPTDFTPWHHDLWKKREEAQEETRNLMRQKNGYEKIPLMSKKPWSQSRKKLASIAKKTLSGKIKWSNGADLDPKWDEALAKEAEMMAPAAALADALKEEVEASKS